MLHVPRLLFLLKLFINFSISDSCMGLMKNEFITAFLKYALEGLFSFSILDARFEPTLKNVRMLKITKLFDTKKRDLSSKSNNGDDSKRPRESSLDDSIANTTNTEVFTEFL